MADWNRVTEKPHPGDTLWLVTADWRGGHNQRTIRLHNIYTNEKEALAEWEQLTAENHNLRCGYLSDFDSGFKRFPIRVFKEQKP